MSRFHSLFACCFGVAVLAAPHLTAQQTIKSVDPFARQSSWRVPDRSEVYKQLVEWMQSAGVSQDRQLEVAELWQKGGNQEILVLLADCLAVADDQMAELVEFCRGFEQPLLIPEFSVYQEPYTQGWVRDQIDLIFGRWLASQGYMEEARDHLASLTPEKVADPASLLFFQAIVDYRLLEKQSCLDRINTLLAGQEVPERYVAVARMMKADIEPLRPDSLDEVARLMERIRLRLGHARAGTRVRQEEQEVIAKLDKMIEKLEEQAQQAQAMSGGTAGGNQPSAPPQQQPNGGGASGPGDVDPKDLGDRSDWGNLPPKEREEALQQLGEDLPSHYRDVIEEYFRRLAREGSSSGSP